MKYNAVSRIDPILRQQFVEDKLCFLLAQFPINFCILLALHLVAETASTGCQGHLLLGFKSRPTLTYYLAPMPSEIARPTLRNIPTKLATETTFNLWPGRPVARLLHFLRK